MKPTMEILARISQNSLANKEEVFTKLYRYLLRPDIYFVAYKNLYANSGAATKGVNEDTADGFSEAKIDSIIKALADETYQPMPVRRTYIQKKNNRKKLRPLGIPTFTDKLVQEVLRMILEAVYEPIFLDVSHGFRPKRSCHTALKQLRREFNGTRWFVEGDIKGCFDNIYLHELDKFVMKLKSEFDTPGVGQITPEYRELHNEIKRLSHRLTKVTGEEREMVMAEYKPKRQKLMSIPCTAQTDKKLKYVRYADDFLIAVKGNREDCQWIKSKLAEFIGDTLKMELSEDKTLITHSSKCARFLGYDVRVRRSGKIKRGGPGHVKMRTLNGGVELLVPLNDKIRQFVFTKGVAIQKEDGSMFPVHRKYLVGLTDLEIVSVYNAELRGICNYYGMASNFYKLHYFAYLMEYSCLKNLASKHKISLPKTIDKFNDGTGKWGIPYETKQGNKRRYFANYADCKGKGPATDYISNAAVVYGYAVNTLENRLKAKVCELCGTTESDHYEVHHINKLKNLKGKERWEIAMIAKHRKTLVVCRDCHRSIIHKK